MYLIKNVQIPICREYDLTKAVAGKFQISTGNIGKLEILRKALDARKKNNLKFNFTLLAEIKAKLDHPDLLSYMEPEPYITEQIKITGLNPFIVGAGPAGLFAAVGLVEKGFKPHIFDRGEALEQRHAKVSSFWKKGILDEASNVQFGEGGAGTFSDGKLTSRNRDFYSNRIFQTLIKLGADPQIRYEALPHLGTDRLKMIIKNLRSFLIEKGCKFHWGQKLEDLKIQNGKLKELKISGISYSPEVVILATGNAARDVFQLLHKYDGIESKPFALGFRIEHPQEFIDHAFYGKHTDFSLTGPATYRLTAKSNGRGVYSFCMCPGGYVIGTATEKEHLVVNGMSFSKRSNKFANSAIVASVDHRDIGNGPLAGVEFQRKIEADCFRIGSDYRAPAQTASDFIRSELNQLNITTSFLPAVNPIDINNCFPAKLIEPLKTALLKFDKRVPGFIKKGILIAPETRTSSPVRIKRDKTDYHSVIAQNLYPAGEGSGYAGGIISSAVDGYRISQLFYL